MVIEASDTQLGCIGRKLDSKAMRREADSSCRRRMINRPWAIPGGQQRDDHTEPVYLINRIGESTIPGQKAAVYSKSGFATLTGKAVSEELRQDQPLTAARPKEAEFKTHWAASQCACWQTLGGFMSSPHVSMVGKSWLSPPFANQRQLWRTTDCTGTLRYSLRLSKPGLYSKINLF